MKKNNNICFAYTQNAGEMNQARGAAQAIAKEMGAFSYEKNLFVENGLDKQLKRQNFENEQDFKKAVNQAINAYFEKCKTEQLDIPKIFIVPYCQADNEYARENIDTWSELVKSHYQENKLGTVKTVALTAKMHRYRSVDMVHIPDHAMTKADEDALHIYSKQKPALAKKFKITQGIIHPMTPAYIKQHRQSAKVSEFIRDNNLENDQPKAVFCLGGRVSGPEIVFDMQVGKKILEQALALKNKGYQVVMTNGPRTPADVTDMLFEQAKENGIAFINSKPLAKTEEDRKNWIKYDGKHLQEFENQAQKYGNIYPGIAGLNNTAVIHTSDTYACCETASCGIPTAIFEIPIDEKVRPDCIKLYQTMTQDGYALKAATLLKTEPAKVNLKVLANPAAVLARQVKQEMNASWTAVLTGTKKNGGR